MEVNVLMGQTIVRFTLFAVLAAWFGLMGWVAVQSQIFPWKPDIPVYPGAQQVSRVVKMDRDFEQTTITLVTSDTPLQVEQYYIRELENRGWRWEKDCNFFVHSGGRWGYIAYLTEDYTIVRKALAQVKPRSVLQIGCVGGRLVRPRS